MAETAKRKALAALCAGLTACNYAEVAPDNKRSDVSDVLAADSGLAVTGFNRYEYLGADGNTYRCVLDDTQREDVRVSFVTWRDFTQATVQQAQTSPTLQEMAPSSTSSTTTVSSTDPTADTTSSTSTSTGTSTPTETTSSTFTQQTDTSSSTQTQTQVQTQGFALVDDIAAVIAQIEAQVNAIARGGGSASALNALVNTLRQYTGDFRQCPVAAVDALNRLLKTIPTVRESVRATRQGCAGVPLLVALTLLLVLVEGVLSMISARAEPKPADFDCDKLKEEYTYWQARSDRALDEWKALKEQVLLACGEARYERYWRPKAWCGDTIECAAAVQKEDEKLDQLMGINQYLDELREALYDKGCFVQ